MRVSFFLITLALLLPGAGEGAQSLAPPTPLTPPPAEETPAARLLTLEAARRAQQMGLPSLAVSLYRQLLATPDSALPRNTLVLDLATALLDEGDAAGATQALRDYVGLPGAAYRLRLGLAAVQQKRYEAARAEAGAIRPEELPAADRGWFDFLQGYLADVAGEPSRAEPLYAQALEAATTALERARFTLARERARLTLGQASETQLAAFRQTMEQFSGQRVGYSAVASYAVALAALDRRPEAVAVLSRHLQALPAEEARTRDEFQLLLGVIAGAQAGAGRSALSSLLASGGDADQQRVALQLLADASADGANRTAFRGELSRLIEAPQPHRILEDLLLFRAQLLLKEKNYTQAEDDAKQLLEKFPGSQLKANALGVLVAAAWERSRYRLAADYAGQAAAASGGRVRAQLGVVAAEAWFRAGDFRTAVEAYGSALADVPAGTLPGDLMFQRVLAEIESGEDRLDAAEALLDAQIQDERFDALNRWKSEWSLARALQAAGRIAAAYARVNRLLAEPAAQEEVSADLRARLAWLQARLSFDAGEPERTLALVEAMGQDLQDGLEAAPRDELISTSMLLAAEANLALGRSPEALQLLQKLRADFPRADAAIYSYVVQAEDYAAKEQFVEAQGLLVKLAEEFRDSPYAAYALYLAALHAERRGQDAYLREANRLIERLVDAYPQSELVFYARLKQGDLLRRLNQFSAAQQAYESLEIHFPEHRDLLVAQLALADTHSAQAGTDASHVESATTRYERLLDRVDATVDLRVEAGFKLGLALAKRGQPGRAEEVWWKQVVTAMLFDPARAELLGPRGRYWMARTIMEIGTLFEQQNRREQAREAYGIILSHALPGASLARARLAKEGAL